MSAPIDVVIVGAGLAGLTAADALNGAGLSVRVIESRPRLGGRTLTIEPDGVTGAFDLGATWIWSDQPEVNALVRRLGIGTFAQHDAGRHLAEEIDGAPPTTAVVAPTAAPALRLDGGAQQLCHLLGSRLPPESVRCGATVIGIACDGSGVSVTTDEQSDPAGVRAGTVIVAVPPRLALEKIRFDPPLPDDVVRVMNLTPTWMAGAIKCLAVYGAPFWREQGLSGTAFSSLGPLREIHDASPARGPGALWGLFSGEDEYREMGPAERADRALAQLARLFGPDAGEPVQYLERDWSSDPNTNDEVFWVDEPLLEYGDPLLAQPLFDGRLIWAGAETVAAGGGHLEGAVTSGLRAAATARRVPRQSST